MKPLTGRLFMLLSVLCSSKSGQAVDGRQAETLRCPDDRLEWRQLSGGPLAERARTLLRDGGVSLWPADGNLAAPASFLFADSRFIGSKTQQIARLSIGASRPTAPRATRTRQKRRTDDDRRSRRGLLLRVTAQLERGAVRYKYKATSGERVPLLRSHFWTAE